MTTSVTLPQTPTGAAWTFVSTAAPVLVDPTSGTLVVDVPTFRLRSPTTPRHTVDPSSRASTGTGNDIDHGGFDGSLFVLTDLQYGVQRFALGQSIVVGALLLSIVFMAVYFLRVSFPGSF